MTLIISPWISSDHTRPATLAGTRRCSRRATSRHPKSATWVSGSRSVDALPGAELSPVGIGCYFERDIVYTLQKRLVAQIDAERPPFRVYNDYPISRAQ